MIRLYHFGAAICAQKVRLALAEKGLQWESSELNLADLRSPEYLALNPNGVAPTLIHDDLIVVESRIISEYLEDAFPTPALMPPDPKGRYLIRYWTKQIDDSLHLDIFTLTFVLSIRDQYLKMTPEKRNALLPGLRNPAKREKTLELLNSGFESKYLTSSVERFIHLANEINETLSDNPWLAGDMYSLADADLTPYFKRLEDLGLGKLWAERHNLSNWIERCRERPSYKTAILDWFTPEDKRIIDMNKLKGQMKFDTLLKNVS